MPAPRGERASPFPQGHVGGGARPGRPGPNPRGVQFLPRGGSGRSGLCRVCWPVTSLWSCPGLVCRPHGAGVDRVHVPADGRHRRRANEEGAVGGSWPHGWAVGMEGLGWCPGARGSAECRTLGLRQLSLEVQLGSGQWVCGEGALGASPPTSLCSSGSRAVLRAPLCPLGLGLWASDVGQLLRGGKRSPQAAGCTLGL